MRLVLAFVLGVVTATAAPVIAAERASDWILNIDRATANGVIQRRLSYCQHVDPAPADWPGMRGASAQSLAALDGWMQTKGWGAWWMSFNATEREGARQAILLGQ